MPTQKDTVRSLLKAHGQTYADELGINLSKPTPSALFQLLCASILFSARINAELATESMRALKRHGWRTARGLAQSSWDERVEALTEGGYTRYRERTATMLGDTSRHVLECWSGDLRKLRDAADRAPRRERELLKEAKGLGDVGVDIFFREVQVTWRELVPFADPRALAAAKRLKLGGDAAALHRHAAGPSELTRLVAALVRCDLAGDHDEILASA